MTKNNNNEQNATPINKPMMEMDDIEFITYADYLSSPYYRAYIEAKSRAQGQAASWASVGNEYSDGNNAPSKSKQETKNKKKLAKATVGGKIAKQSKMFTKKRGFALVVIALLMLVVIAAAAMGAIGIASVDGFVAAYIEPGATVDTNVNIGIIDPILGTVKDLAKVEIDSNFYDIFLASKPVNASIMTKIPMYAVPAAALLIVIFAIIGFIKALVALFANKTSEYVKKYNFGFISIVMFLCGLVMAIGGIYIANIDIAKALDFITQKSTILNAGFGLYAVIAIPVVTFICSCFGYKKAK